MTVELDAYAADFDEEPGYLDFAAVGPLSRSVLAEQAALSQLLATARHGALETFAEQSARVTSAAAAVTGHPVDQIVFQPNTSTGLMHTMLGITGDVALSAAEFPSLTFAAARASEALQVLTPQWISTDYGRVTPATLRDQLDSTVTAVAVSLVDFRTGYLADLEGIRQVIGDRLLIVDAIQGFGVVDAPWQIADVVLTGGQKWVRAGWGTGLMMLSERAAEQLVPVVSGYTGTGGAMPLDRIDPPARGARAFSVSNPDPIAQARLAVALESIAEVGVEEINATIADIVARIIDIADEFAVPVASSRAPHERAGIVVLTPATDQLTTLTASLHNHGISCTTRAGSVRLSAHVSTTDETIEMLRAALLGWATAVG